MPNLRKHQMQRYSQLLCTMDMGEARRVGDDGVGDKRFFSWATTTAVGVMGIVDLVAIGTRLPTPLENLGHALSTFAHVAFSE